MLKTGIFVESKAINHYTESLKAADWDETTSLVIAKDQADEDGHIKTWKRFLVELG